MTVNEILEMMKYELESYENPGAYLSESCKRSVMLKLTYFER